MKFSWKIHEVIEIVFPIFQQLSQNSLQFQVFSSPDSPHEVSMKFHEVFMKFFERFECPSWSRFPWSCDVFSDSATQFINLLAFCVPEAHTVTNVCLIQLLVCLRRTDRSAASCRDHDVSLLAYFCTGVGAWTSHRLRPAVWGLNRG